MIELADIQKAIGIKLSQLDIPITAGEVAEGFEKPSFFVDVFPVSAEGQNAYLDYHEMGIEIMYFPKLETKLECLKMAQQIKCIFGDKLLRVDDRCLSLENMTFRSEKSELNISFDISFYDDSGIEMESVEDTMQELNYREVVK